MATPKSSAAQRNSQMSPEGYARLKAEAMAPYRGLRQFIYVGFGASGFIGGVVFLAQLLAGRNVESALPNLALQVGVVALMVGLFRWEQRASRRASSKK
jgi:Low psii accumulation1 / Rep27